jgi:hypothetical protein
MVLFIRKINKEDEHMPGRQKFMNYRFTLFRKILSAFLLCMLTLGCASIIRGSNQVVAFKSNPPEAKFKIYDNNGELIVNNTTPNVVTLKRGNGYFKKKSYKVVVEKEGYQTMEFQIEGKVNGWYLGGNLIFGGLIGYLIVDPLTGAMWTLSPEEINATLPGIVQSLSRNEGLMIVLSAKISDRLLKRTRPDLVLE